MLFEGSALPKCESQTPDHPNNDLSRCRSLFSKMFTLEDVQRLHQQATELSGFEPVSNEGICKEVMCE
jgi:hypothetical protein